MPHPKGPARFDEARARRNFAAIALVMNDHYLRHLLQLYKAFDGDLVAAIVLGEVAHHNLSAIRQGLTPRQLTARLGEPGVRDSLVPTNAFSIAQATGIPRETVRRKVAYLVRRGLLVQDARANLVLTAANREVFADFNLQLLQELLECADRLGGLLTDAPD